MNENAAVSDGDAVHGVSRRSMLKRGAVAGATLAWSVPVISAISMTPAHAESPSAPSGQKATTSGNSSQAATTQLASGGGNLASTGSDVSLTAAAGVAAAVLGAGALAASKYRSNHAADDAPGE